MVKKSATDAYNKWKKDDRLKFLESSIHWLRDEALTLCKSLEDIKLQNVKLRTEIIETKKENNYLQEYTKSTKRENLKLKKVIETLKDPQNLIRYAEVLSNPPAVFVQAESIGDVDIEPKHMKTTSDYSTQKPFSPVNA